MNVEIVVRIEAGSVKVLVRSSPIIPRVILQIRYPSDLTHKLQEIIRLNIIIEFAVYAADPSHVVNRRLGIRVAVLAQKCAGILHGRKLGEHLFGQLLIEKIVNYNM